MLTAKEARLLAAKNNPEVDYNQIENIFEQIEDAAKSGKECLSFSLDNTTISTRIALTHLIEDYGFTWETCPTWAVIYW